MAKKIDTAVAKQLKNIGITAKTEEEARQKLLKALEKEGIEGMEEESTETLIEMVESFKLDDAVEDDDTAGEDTDEELDELAEEVEADDEEDAEEDDTEEEEADDEEEDEVEDEPAPAPAPKKAAKSTKKAETPKKDEKKATKAAAPAKAKKRGNKLDPKNNEEDREPLNAIKELFGEDYEFDWLASNGGTVKHIGKNGKRGVVALENLTRQNDGKVTCNLYLLTMKNDTEVLDELGYEYSKCWTNAPFLKCVTLEEAEDIIKSVKEHITGSVKKIDKRLGENRKKMEENLKKSSKTASKKATTEPEEEVEEETPTPKPTKKVAPAKKAAAKKTKK